MADGGLADIETAARPVSSPAMHRDLDVVGAEKVSVVAAFNADVCRVRLKPDTTADSMAPVSQRF